MRTARAVPRPCDWRKTMMSRTAFCCFQLSRMRAMRAGPMPLTSLRKVGLSSITWSVRSPKTPTILPAYLGPMPLTRPEPGEAMPVAAGAPRGAGGGGPALGLLFADPLAEGDSQSGMAHRSLQADEAGQLVRRQHGERSTDGAGDVLASFEEAVAEAL